MAIDIGWAGIINDSDTGEIVEQKLTNTFQNIENELNILDVKSKHGLLLNAFSAVNQEPTGLGAANAIQIEFGAAQSTPDVSIDALGTVTFHTAGTYTIRFEAHFGRTGSTGASLLAFRAVLNDVQYSNPQVSKLSDADVLLAWADIYTVTVGIGDTMKGFLMRVIGSNDSGGLFTTDTVEWGTAMSASLQVHKVG